MPLSDLLLGLAIGDACAAGLEFQDRDWIRQHVDFSHFINARDQIQVAPEKLTAFTNHYQPWDYTDDTEMTIGSIKGLPSDSKYTAGAVLYILKHASDAFDALKKSVHLGGDVDSLAALTTGILAGRLGVNSLPTYMIEAVEGRDYLQKIATMWGG